MMSWTKWAAPLALVGWTTGCFHAGVPLRSARVGDAGEVRLGLTWTVAGFTLGGVDGSEGNSTQRSAVAPMAIVPAPVFLLHNVLLDLRVGAADGTEVGAVLGFQAIGAEVRRQVEDRAERAVAVEAAGEWVPIDGGFRVRSGVRASGQVDGAWLGGLWLSYGTEAHAVASPSDGCLLLACMRGLVRRELRLLALAGGLGQTERGELGGGLVGHAILWGGPAVGKPFETSRGDTVHEWVGAHLVFGGQFKP